MPSLFRTKVKEAVKGGATRQAALTAAKDAMSGPLTTRQQKRYDRGMKVRESGTQPLSTTPAAGTSGLNNPLQKKLDRQKKKLGTEMPSTGDTL